MTMPSTSSWATSGYGDVCPEEAAAIGVGAAKVQPDGASPPHRALVRYLRKQWRCDVNVFPATFACVLDEDKHVTVLEDIDAATPYLFILTAPRLGGGEMPDALAQAVYLMPVRRWSSKARRIWRKSTAKPSRTSWSPKTGMCMSLQAQPWAEIQSIKPLPENARLRPDPGAAWTSIFVAEWRVALRPSPFQQRTRHNLMLPNLITLSRIPLLAFIIFLALPTFRSCPD